MNIEEIVETFRALLTALEHRQYVHPPGVPVHAPAAPPVVADAPAAPPVVADAPAASPGVADALEAQRIEITLPPCNRPVHVILH